MEADQWEPASLLVGPWLQAARAIGGIHDADLGRATHFKGSRSVTDRILSIGAIARREGVTTTTVRNWIRSGKLTARRTPTGRYRVRETDLDAALVKINTKESKESKGIDGRA
jgi:excisionase family DNA binding protein